MFYCRPLLRVKFSLIPLLLMLILASVVSTQAHALTFNVTDPTDLPDTDLTDGDCIAATGNCTLRAAFEQLQAVQDSLTGECLSGTLPTPLDTATVNIELNDYNLSRELKLEVRCKVFETIQFEGEEMAGSQTKIIAATGSDGIVLSSQEPFAAYKTWFELRQLNIFRGVTALKLIGQGTGDCRLKCTHFILEHITTGQDLSPSLTVHAGIEVSDAVFDADTIDVSGSNFKSGILLDNSISIIRHSFIHNNKGFEEPGGIRASGSFLLIEDSKISDNGTIEHGGGLYSTSNYTRIIRSTFDGNYAHLNGTGLVVEKNFTLNASTLAYNRSDMGGSVALVDHRLATDNYTAYITNSTFSNNVLRGDESVIGGTLVFAGPRDDSHVSTANIAFSTLVENDSGSLGGIGVLSADNLNIHLQNTVVANNLPRDCVAGDGTLPITSDLSFDSDGSCGVSLTGDPQLGPLQNNGGPTLTHKPNYSSPLVDAGVDACILLDQRGQPRPADGNDDGIVACDIGSVEIDYPNYNLPTCTNGTLVGGPWVTGICPKIIDRFNKIAGLKIPKFELWFPCIVDGRDCMVALANLTDIEREPLDQAFAPWGLRWSEALGNWWFDGFYSLNEVFIKELQTGNYGPEYPLNLEYYQPKK